MIRLAVHIFGHSLILAAHALAYFEMIKAGDAVELASLMGHLLLFLAVLLNLFVTFKTQTEELPATHSHSPLEARTEDF